jgi:UDP-N-acetylmuramate dehydrogenase
MSLEPIEKDLSAQNTMALPCSAKRFYVLETDDELQGFFAEQQGNVLILGGGSNVILPPVLTKPVVQLAHAGIEIIDETDTSVTIQVGASVVWDDLVAWTVEHGYYGLENLSLIPGSVGAAPVQNIGAYGVELKDTMSSVRAFDREQQAFVELNTDQCQFEYRDSIFKRQTGRFVITRVTFELSKFPEFCLEYGELRSLAECDDLSLKRVRDKVIAVRQAKLPDPEKIPNSGSFFKNPVVSAEQYFELKKKFSDLVAYPLENKQYKLAAGWLIDNAGLRGQSIGPIAVHRKQALVLTNLGGAEQEDVTNAASEIQQHCLALYGLELEIEPVIV